MLNRKATFVLALFLCVFLVGACAATPPSGTLVDVEKEELATYQEEPLVPYDYPEELEEPEEPEELEEELLDDELEEEPEPEEPPQPPEQRGDAADEVQQNQQPVGEQQTVAQQEPAVQQPEPQQQPAPNQAEVAAQTVTGSDFEMEVIRLINMQRQSAGLSPLSANAALMRGARIRAQELDSHFSHTRPNGSEWQTVLSYVGYQNTSAGENIAAGQASPSAALNSWMSSQGHRNNILDSAYTETGVGAVQGSDGRWRWVQLFGGAGTTAAGGGASGSQGQNAGTTWAPARAQYSISMPSGGRVVPGDALTFSVVTSDPSIPFTVSWSRPQSNSWWSFRDGVLEIHDHLGPDAPPFSASVTVFEFGNPVRELEFGQAFGR